MSTENLSATPSLSSIESAIKLVDVKKDELKKAFEDLQANSMHLSSFSISWSDLDAHFTAIQNSVTQRFRILESRESFHNPIDSRLARFSTQPHASKQGVSSAPNPLTEQDRVASVVNQSSSQPVPLDGEKPSSSNSVGVQSDGSVLPSGHIDSVVNQSSSKHVPLDSQKPTSSNSVGVHSDGSAPPSDHIDSVVTRPELKEFCERMDGKGLRKYIYDRIKEREAIRMELPIALKSAADPGAMILDAMEGFYSENSQSNGYKDPGALGLRRVCVGLLEQLMDTGLSFSEQARARAKKLALEWKGKFRLLKDNSLEVLAFLHLVATYGLGLMFDKEELVEYIFTVAKLRQATKLCRSIGIGEKIHDLIQRLLDDGKQFLAVRFIFEFGLVEKFPPVPLLDEYLKETKKLAEKLCKDGNYSLKSQNEATGKEIAALKTVIKIIEERHLETEYSPEPLQKRIEQLEKEQADRKPPATPAASKPQQQHQQQADKKPPATPAASKPQQQHQQQTDKKPPTTPAPPQPQQHHHQQQADKKPPASQPVGQQSGNKRPKTSASVAPTSAVPPFQPAHHQPAGSWPNHSAAYFGSPPSPFSFPGSTSYAGPSAPMYGFAGAPRGFPVNPNPDAPYYYNYERPPFYGAYDFPPQYHPPYRPW